MVEQDTQDIIFQMELKKDYNVKTDGRNFFDQPINDDIKIYENRKIATGPGGD